MFSLSTSWNSSNHNDGSSLVKEIKSIGFDTIELGFAMTKKVVDDILLLKNSSEIKVSSLHNMCPLPPGIDLAAASPDHYSLTAPDDNERNLAIEIAKNTIRYAKRFEARAVVLHAGRVEIKDRTRELAAAIQEQGRFNELKKKMIREREERKGLSIDRLIRSLTELVPFAINMGVSLAIETRYYYREIPLLEEMEEVFKHFKKGELFYWHDAGHAEVFERLGLVRHKTFLDKFSNRLIGVHLHDIIGIMYDHRAPGTGTFDFTVLKPYITTDTIKVIEVHQPVTGDEIRKGLDYLKGIFK